ncbi:hypothetical protein V1525DRAFT_406889 [Lipomyces kononenkoae]|uniref:Uncharacterized protein n=1 Tax=Lipomyces kononenkoae TaxID=34357 RepID=A0ACC3SXU3_LIPKO
MLSTFSCRLWNSMPQSRTIFCVPLSRDLGRLVTGTSPIPSLTAALHAASTGVQPPSRRRLKFDLSKPLTFRESLRIEQAREERKGKERQEALVNAAKGVPNFHDVLETYRKWPLQRGAPNIMQVNIGKLCNLTCRHCHVESGPTKLRENMDYKTVRRCLELIEKSPSIETVDITGGAPELNPHFRLLVAEARAMGKTVIDRCNLVVLFEVGQEDLSAFLAAQEVNIVASLPCYTEENIEKQRGKRVFTDSIAALKMLNSHGYGQPSRPGLRLDLVYNPTGPTLPPKQSELEDAYRQRLFSDHGIVFTSLLALTNMPIKRFADTLLHSGQYSAYMQLLANSFNEGTVDGLMCRNTVNVAWDGKVYDCDFNAAIGMGSRSCTGQELDIWSIDNVSDLEGTSVRTGKHCFGCTAGSGSSCGGTLT